MYAACRSAVERGEQASWGFVGRPGSRPAMVNSRFEDLHDARYMHGVALAYVHCAVQGFDHFTSRVVSRSSDRTRLSRLVSGSALVTQAKVGRSEVMALGAVRHLSGTRAHGEFREGRDWVPIEIPNGDIPRF
jgi:hypothetical protein